MWHIIENMRKKDRTKVLIYVLVIVVVVYWFFIFHSSSTLRKVGTEGAELPEDFQFDNTHLQNGAGVYFRNPDPALDQLLKEKVYKMLKNGAADATSRSKDLQFTPDDQVKESMSNAMGLTFMNREFFLNGKPFRIFSGSIHYFRVVPDQWRDRLLKLKACGLNTVETYAPWNLHEPSPGVYRFDGILNLRSFIKMAAELGLYVIFRPGPYICSEMDFGGLPGWLLGDPDMKVRSNYKGYIKAVARYFSVLMQKVTDLQFTEGGPIIMVQVENEYAVYGENIEHLKMLTFMLRNAGIRELLVTSDNSYTQEEMLFHEYALPTSNAARFRMDHYQAISVLNPHFPFMVMELWTGWFSAWGERYKAGRSIASVNETIHNLLSVGGSFNLYMFHGGTNFGFSAGATNDTAYKSLVTSYDYDALLTESGDITAKYMAVREIMTQFYKTIGISSLPPIPSDTPKKAYGRLKMEETLTWKALLEAIPKASRASSLTHMENYVAKGEHYSGLWRPTLGYIIYSHPNIKYMWDSLPGIQVVGQVRDRLLAILSNQMFKVLHGESSDIDPRLDYDWDTHFSADLYEFYWDHGLNYDAMLNRHDWKQLVGEEMLRAVEKIKRDVDFLDGRLDLVVEDLGRVGYSPRARNLLDQQRKGINGPVFNFLQGAHLTNWHIRFLTFDPGQCQIWINTPYYPGPEGDGGDDVMAAAAGLSQNPPPLISGRMRGHRLGAPSLFRTTLTLEQEEPRDTFIHLQGWMKGVVIVNGFHLGRYWNIGPQMSLYLPGPVLRKGKNEILIFEEEQQGESILLSSQPFLGPTLDHFRSPSLK